MNSLTFAGGALISDKVKLILDIRAVRLDQVEGAEAEQRLPAYPARFAQSTWHATGG
ncbi:hypothetical protein [Streptomyces sp. GbtcB6]|uniref:hypothetical protein n=1 Tax=Streptomyces sp. GbtcB6 TaxID=2824751 RepID=UPI001C310C78|nr:hypothetical protein [Streptomyces sp. GbtcB6]